MMYPYHKPPAKASPWWKQWRILLQVAFIVLCLLHTICTPILNYYHQRRRDARAAAVLEPLNAWRRHIGLAPVTPALRAPSIDGDSLIHLSSRESDNARRYGPYLSTKHLRYAGEARRVLWEVDNIDFCPPDCRTRKTELQGIERTYTETPAGQPEVRFEFSSSNGDTRSITRAEADSVLRYWKAQGVSDSLKAVAAARQRRAL